MWLSRETLSRHRCPHQRGDRFAARRGRHQSSPGRPRPTTPRDTRGNATTARVLSRTLVVRRPVASLRFEPLLRRTHRRVVLRDHRRGALDARSSYRNDRRHVHALPSKNAPGSHWPRHSCSARGPVVVLLTVIHHALITNGGPCRNPADLYTTGWTPPYAKCRPSNVDRSHPVRSRGSITRRSARRARGAAARVVPARPRRNDRQPPRAPSLGARQDRQPR